jgi:hypothetical protein
MATALLIVAVQEQRRLEVMIVEVEALQVGQSPA